MKIEVTLIHPPIPIRTMDYSAIDTDTYDGAPDAGVKSQRQGTGSTADEALQELAEQMMDDYTDEEWTQKQLEARERGDLTTVRFIECALGRGLPPQEAMV